MNDNLTLLPTPGGGTALGGPRPGGPPGPGSGPTTGRGPTPGRGPTTTREGRSGDPVLLPGNGGVPSGGIPGGPGAPGVPGAPGSNQARLRGLERASAQLRAWDSQAEQVKALYPSFDLSLEARSRDFRAMLRAGVPMRQAFEVLHMEQIKAAQAQAAERAVTANIRARGARPQENGAGAASAFTVKDDVSRLTAQDRAEMARRAARGETITF